jgi:hypothetical protein
MALGARNNRLDAGHQFILVEWPGQIIFAAEFQRLNFCFDNGVANKISIGARTLGA